jgi:ferredoxin
MADTAVRQVARRRIVQIDEGKCDGCGLCVPACQEGALQIIDGKARLVSDVYCDGLGACLGDCPRGAITIVEREAEEFDPEAVEEREASEPEPPTPRARAHAPAVRSAEGGCPGSRALTLQPKEQSAPSDAPAADEPSALSNWPLQIHLVPVQAPYLQGARLLIAADCVGFALPGFHRRFLRGRTLLVGCPKLDDADAHRHKLTEILRHNDVQSVEVVYMEVPCCFGLVHLVRLALEESGRAAPLTLTKIGIAGNISETVTVDTMGGETGDAVKGRDRSFAALSMT